MTKDQAAKIWTKQEADDLRKQPIINAIKASPVFVERCLLVLYARQTTTEQETNSTIESNGRGFSSNDSDFGSSLAKQIMLNKYKQADGHRLTSKQLKYARRMCNKYVGQLADHAEEAEAYRAVMREAEAEGNMPDLVPSA